MFTQSFQLCSPRWALMVFAINASVLLGVSPAFSQQPASVPTESSDVGHQASDYWIGIMGQPLDPLLKKHLKLDHGILVRRVVPDSPASTAGLRIDDIVLQYDGQVVHDVEGLSAAIGATRERACELVVLREGEELTLQVTPQQRPSKDEPPATDQLSDLPKWFEAWRKAQSEPGAMKLLITPPTYTLPNPWNPTPWKDSKSLDRLSALPANTSITITRDDTGPAKIVVQQEEERWEATDGELDKLPDSIRKTVHAILGSQMPWMTSPPQLIPWSMPNNDFNLLPPYTPPGGSPPVPPTPTPSVPPEAAPPSGEQTPPVFPLHEHCKQQFESLRKQMEDTKAELQKELKELRELWKERQADE